jgi:PAS domain S-box-containing protein
VSDQKRVFLLILVMTAVSGAIGVAAVGLLYHAAFAEEQQRLSEIVMSRARLIKATARFDETYGTGYPNGPREATLSQIRNAQTGSEYFGTTGEFTVAERKGDYIQFVLPFRHAEAGASRRIPLQSDLAEPMRRALAGRSGTLVGLDYRGVKVLAAHEPVAPLDLGIVAKIDLAEIRAPFLRAGTIVGGTALLLIAAGILIFFRVSKPILQRIADSEERFRSISQTAPDAIIMMDSEGKASFWNNAAERIFGYKGSEACGQALTDLIIPERYQRRHTAAIEDFFRTGQGLLVNKRVEFQAERKGGTEFPVEISLSGVRLGGRWNAVGIIRDITERKNAEQTVQEKQGLLEQINCAGRDTGFMQVAALYRGHPDFDVHALVAELVESEAVPFLPVLRYKPTGLRKREVWMRTWTLQRREDAIDAEVEESFHHEGHEEHEVRGEKQEDNLRVLRGSKTSLAGAIEIEQKRRKHQEIGEISPPPKYRSADFLDPSFWCLRGSLDVPKERFVSYPHCSKAADPSLVVAWAGWDHLQQARALAAYYLGIKGQEGWSPEHLAPLLTGLLELIPWVRQWHSDPDSSGARMGDDFDSFVADEARELHLTPEQIRSWTPPRSSASPRRKQH